MSLERVHDVCVSLRAHCKHACHLEGTVLKYCV